MADRERFRRFIVHGWAFRDLPEHEVKGIRDYLEDGDPSHLPLSYQRLRTAIRTKHIDSRRI